MQLKVTLNRSTDTVLAEVDTQLFYLSPVEAERLKLALEQALNELQEGQDRVPKHYG